MGINYVENDNGRRKIRWGGVFVFLAFCLAIPMLLLLFTYFRGTLAQNFPSICTGFFEGVFIFSIALGRSIKMPVEQLPRSAGR